MAQGAWTGANVSDAPSAFPEGGFAEGGLRDAGWHLPLVARVFISRRGGCSWRWGRFLQAGVLAEGWRWCYDPGRAAESVAASD